MLASCADLQVAPGGAVPQWGQQAAFERRNNNSTGRGCGSTSKLPLPVSTSSTHFTDSTIVCRSASFITGGPYMTGCKEVRVRVRETIELVRLGRAIRTPAQCGHAAVIVAVTNQLFYNVHMKCFNMHVKGFKMRTKFVVSFNKTHLAPPDL